MISRYWRVLFLALVDLIMADAKDLPRAEFDPGALAASLAKDSQKIFEWARDRTWWAPVPRPASRGQGCDARSCRQQSRPGYISWRPDASCRIHDEAWRTLGSRRIGRVNSWATYNRFLTSVEVRPRQ